MITYYDFPLTVTKRTRKNLIFYFVKSNDIAALRANTKWSRGYNLLCHHLDILRKLRWNWHMRVSEYFHRMRFRIKNVFREINEVVRILNKI